MNYTLGAALLPTLWQKVAILVMAVLTAFWIARLVRSHRIREEHALLWFLGLGAGVFVVWCSPLLNGITRLLGITLPASALLLLMIFFLLLVSMWLTAIVSGQKQQIAKLIMAVSIVKARLAEHERDAHGGEKTS